MGMLQTKKASANKGNSYDTEETAYKTGENLCRIGI
jgi:hypothetical protein